MRVRQPRVEWEQRHLDRKGKEKADKGGGRNQNVFGERHVRLPRSQKRNVESVGRRVQVQRDDAQKHKHRARQRVHKELDSRVLRAVRIVSPNTDEEIHRHQTNFPEQVEQEQVEGNKHTHHAHFQQQEQGKKFLDPMIDDARRIKQTQRGQQSGEPNERHAQAICAQMVLNAQHRNPWRAFAKRVRRACGIHRHTARVVHKIVRRRPCGHG